MHHTFMHAHNPAHNLCLWPKRPPLSLSVAETSKAEMSVAEMSYIQLNSGHGNINYPEILRVMYMGKSSKFPKS